MQYRDRIEAGQQLAPLLRPYANRADVLVLGLPRGGIPVAFAVAEHLSAPLGAYVVRKLGVPGHEELAMGAIATGGIRILNATIIHQLGIPPAAVEAVTSQEQRQLQQREQLYQGNRPLPAIQGRTVILIDDGLATGATMRAAVAALRQQQPAWLVVAVPIAARSICDKLRTEVDEVVCATTPEPFYAVGLWYEDFSPTSDEEVCELLARAAQRQTAAAATGEGAPAPA